MLKSTAKTYHAPHTFSRNFFFASIFGYFHALQHVHVHFGTRLQLVKKSADCVFSEMRHLLSLRCQHGMYMAALSIEHLRRRLLRMNLNLQIPVF